MRPVLRSAIAGQWRLLAVGAALAASHQAGEALVPVLIGVVIDRATSTSSVASLVTWLAVLAVDFVWLSLSFRFGLRAAERAAVQAAHELRLGLTERILDPRGGADRGRLPGALVDIATEDTRRVGSAVATAPFGIAAVAGLLVSAAALLRVSVPLGLLVLAGTPALLLLAHLLGRPLERRSAVERERAAHASGLAADLVAGLRVLKGIGGESAAVGRYRHVSQDSLAATLRAARAQAWHDGGIQAAGGVFIAVVALAGGWLAARGSVTVGGLVAAVGLAQFLREPLTTFAWANGEFAQGRASAVRIGAVLASAPAVTAGSARPSQPVRGHVRLRGVRLGPLRDVHLEAAPGELVGVVAADPAAARALLDCLGREAEPEAGTVELDGVALPHLEVGAVRAAILVAAHDADLFEGTLAANVRGNTAGGVARAMASAAADEVARALPQGATTVVAERGRSLSGGQRQRVALARAFAADPPVLVLHDPTTAVDAVTEARIAASLRAVRAGHTTVLVTTSPALLAVTDRVVVLTDGTVTAAGRHADLVRDRPDYRAAVLP